MFNKNFIYLSGVIGFILFIVILAYNTYLFNSKYLKPCKLSPPCKLAVFSISESSKGYEFIGYCIDTFMLKTLSVYIKDCRMHVEHSLFLNIMMVLILLYIIYVAYLGFKTLILKK